jgi:hypothetical protein
MSTLNKQEIITKLLSVVLNDPNIHTPVYLDFLHTEQECESFMNSIDSNPLVYIWNENKELGTYSVSVSGKEVKYWLEKLNLVKQDHPQFNEIRDEAMLVISKVSDQAINSVCSKSGLFPSDIYKIT